MLQFLNTYESFNEYEILNHVFLNYLSNDLLFSANDIFFVELRFNFKPYSQREKSFFSETE